MTCTRGVRPSSSSSTNSIDAPFRKYPDLLGQLAMVMVLILLPGIGLQAQVLVDFEGYVPGTNALWVAEDFVTDQYSAIVDGGFTFSNRDTSGVELQGLDRPQIAKCGGTFNYSNGDCPLSPGMNVVCAQDGFSVGPRVNYSQGGLGCGHLEPLFPFGCSPCTNDEDYTAYDRPVYDENLVPDPADPINPDMLPCGDPPDLYHDMGATFLTSKVGGIPIVSDIDHFRVDYQDTMNCTQVSGAILDTDVRDGVASSPQNPTGNDHDLICGYECWNIIAYDSSGVALKTVRVYPFDAPDGAEYWDGDLYGPNGPVQNWPEPSVGNPASPYFACTAVDSPMIYDTTGDNIPDQTLYEFRSYETYDAIGVPTGVPNGHLRGDGSVRRFEIDIGGTPSIGNRIAYITIKQISDLGGSTVGLGFDLFSPCDIPSGTICSVQNETILCDYGGGGGDYTVTFDVVNDTGFDVHKLLIPGVVNGASISPNIIDLVPPLPAGGTAAGIELTVTGGIVGDTLCIPVGLMAKDDLGEEFQCCGTEVCVELPSCCMNISNEVIAVDVNGNYSYTFALTNSPGEDPAVAGHLFMDVVSPTGVSIGNEWQDLGSLADGASIALNTTIIGALPGDEVCIQFTIHDATLNECCGIVHCITIPGGQTPPCDAELSCEPSTDIDGNPIVILNWIWPEPTQDCCAGDLSIEVDGVPFASGLPNTGNATLNCIDGIYCLICSDSTGVQTVVACCEVTCIPLTSPAPEFLRGDANSDGFFDISDVVNALDYLFQATAVPCLVALEGNDDEVVNIADPIYSLEALFGGGPSPWPPYQQCGADETSGNLGCEYFPACEGNDSGPQDG